MSLFLAFAVLLGTGGGPTPKTTRSAPANALVVGDTVYVIDCGNGVGRQLRLAGLDLAKVRHVFVTHHHSDHVADLVTLPLLIWGSEAEQTITLHGPPPLKKAVKAGLKEFAFDIDTRIADEGKSHAPDRFPGRLGQGPVCPWAPAHRATRVANGSRFRNQRGKSRYLVVTKR